MGIVYGDANFAWRKHLCFEKALRLNPDNTSLRFTLAYSYGESGYGIGMAAHHYRILLNQRPADSISMNNLSLIYDHLGATTKKIALLRDAIGLKDNSYVAANLAIAYAKAGFIDDARKSLQDITANEQQEGIVRTAYRNISDQLETEKEINQKLERLIELAKVLVYEGGLIQLHESQNEMQSRFLGGWQAPSGMVLSITEDKGQLKCALKVENEHYEHAVYNLTSQYEPGILELDAALDEKSLKLRPAALRGAGLAFGSLGGIGNALIGGGLLGSALNRPGDVCYFVLVPGEGGTLVGLLATTSRPGLVEREKALLNAKQVRLTRRAAIELKEEAHGVASQ